MKKLMTLAAVVAACAPAFTAEVTSSNIVGYQKVNLGSGYSIIGQSFKNVGSTFANTVQNLIPDDGLDGEGNDSIQVWNGSGYTFYYWYSAEALESEKGGWGDADGVLQDAVLTPGEAFWVRASSEAMIMTSGEVPNDTDVDIMAGYTLVCNPQPVDVSIQDIVPNGLDGEGNDSIQVWNGSGYTFYYWYSAEALESEKGGWGDADGVLQTLIIPSGTGFWIRSSANGSLSFPDALAE